MAKRRRNGQQQRTVYTQLDPRAEVEKLVAAEVAKLVPSTVQGNRGAVPEKTYGLIDAMNAASGAHNFGAYAVPFARNPADDNAFGPGKPIDADPLDAPDPATGQPVPRTWQYPVSWNLPGNGNREVPWQVLRVASTAVDIIRRCIEYRKRTLRGMKPRWVVTAEAIQEAYESSPDAGREDAEKTLRAKYAPVIKELTGFWREPWSQNGLEFGQWVNMVMEEYLVLDAVAIYPRRNLNGDVMDFQVVDGSTIKPLLDVYGCRPADPYAAFQQILYGFPRGEYGPAIDPVTKAPKPGLPASRLFYHRENVRANSPYGLSAVEQALIAARLYLKRQGWMLAEYEDGSTPVTWISPSEDESTKSGQAFTPPIRRAWEDGLNDELGGSTRRRHRSKVLPPGWTAQQTQSVDERYKPDYDLHLIKLLCGFFDVPITELGFSEAKGIGNSGLHEGMADVAAKVGDRPTTEVLAGIITGLARKFQGCPIEVELQFVEKTAAEQSADEATADDLAFKGAQKTLNDVRRAKGLPTYSFAEADMAILVGVGPTGVVFLEGLYDQQQADRQANLAIQQSQMEGNLTDGGASAASPDAGAGPDAQKTAQIGDELSAFNRWRRRNPDPKRPFTFKTCEPDDVDRFYELDPNLMAFEGWTWEPDLEKGAGWDPGVKRFRDARGRFVKGLGGKDVLDALGKAGHDLVGRVHEDALDDVVRRLHAGKKVRKGESRQVDQLHAAGLLEDSPDRKGQLELSEAGRQHLMARTPQDYRGPHELAAEPEPDPGQVARERQARIDRARSIADLGAEVDELRGNEADLDVARRHVAALAARDPGNTELADLAAQVQAVDSVEQMHEIMQGVLGRHGVTADAPAGTVEPFDRSRHRLIGGGDARDVAVVRPGHVFDDNGEQVRLSHAMVEETDTPAPPTGTAAAAAETPSVEDARGASLHDKIRRAEVMYGTDRSKWPAAARAEETKIKMRAAAEERRAARTRPADVQQAQHRDLADAAPVEPLPQLEPSSTVQDMRKLTPAQQQVLARAHQRGDGIVMEPSSRMRTVEALQGMGLVGKDFTLTPEGRAHAEGVSAADLTPAQLDLLRAYRDGTATNARRGTLPPLQARGFVKDGKITPEGRAHLAVREQGAAAPEASMPQESGAGAGSPTVAPPKRFTAEQLKELPWSGATREQIIEHGRKHGLSEADIDAELATFGATRERQPGEAVTLNPINLAHTRQREEHDAYLRENTPRIYDAALGDGPAAVTHAPSRAILASMREQGWTITGVNTGARTMTFESPDGEKHITMQVMANGKTPVWWSGQSKLTLKRANEIVGAGSPTDARSAAERILAEAKADDETRLMAPHPFGAHAEAPEMEPSDRNGERVTIRARDTEDYGTVVGRRGSQQTGVPASNFLVVQHDDGTYQTYDARVVHAQSSASGTELAERARRAPTREAAMGLAGHRGAAETRSADTVRWDMDAMGRLYDDRHNVNARRALRDRGEPITVDNLRAEVARQEAGGSQHSGAAPEPVKSGIERQLEAQIESRDRLRTTLERAKVMYGSDRSTWPARERREAEALDAQLAALDRQIEAARRAARRRR